MQLEEGIDGFLSAEELSWTKKVRNPSSELQVDQEVEVLVIENSPENHSIRLSVRRLADDPWQGFCTAYQVGSQIEGVVSSITDFGLFVKVQGDIEGLIHKANISDSKEEEFETAVKRFEIGTPVKAVIIELSADKQKLALSIKDLNRKQLQAEMSKFMDQGNTSEGFTLGDLLKHKKDDTRDNA